MGAYFEATIVNNGNAIRYDTYSLNNGSKLMEHSYIGNEYVNFIMDKLIKNKSQLVWLCDYHEEDKRCKYTWSNTEEIEENNSSEIHKIIEANRYFILNHNQKQFIDIFELYSEDELVMHPLPILCNSDNISMGGGDYHNIDIRRAIWCLDEIEIVLSKEDVPSNYFNITEACVFREDMR